MMLGINLVNSEDFFNAEVAIISKIMATNKNKKFFMFLVFYKVNYCFEVSCEKLQVCWL